MNKRIQPFSEFIFFGNYFYGLCSVALCVEALLQQKQAAVQPVFCLLLFSVTVFYYTLAYVKTESPIELNNVRSVWYSNNRALVQKTQLLFLLLIVALLSQFIYQNFTNILHLCAYEWLLLLLFPFVALLYYGVPLKGLSAYNLRQLGWLKPFAIGFIWAGLVTIYPLLYLCLKQGLHYEVNLVSLFLFLKNFMFVSVLCIMFDIKDYAMDYNLQLKTLVVKLGLRKTIFYVVIPLLVLGLSSFLGYAFLRDFSILKIGLNTLPFLLTLLVAYSLQNRKSIFYYLVIIDGLMLLKALCGSIAMIYF